MVTFPAKEELVNQLVMLVGYKGCTLFLLGSLEQCLGGEKWP